MKFARRNSLNFPLRKHETPVPEDDGEADYDVFHDVEIKKASAALTNDSDHHSLSATSATSSTSVSSIDDEELLKVNEFNEGASAISTPVPRPKEKLQIPKAKRRDMAIIAGPPKESIPSPTSVPESLDLPALSKKKSRKKSSSRDSSAKSTSSSRDCSQMSKSSSRDSSEKSCEKTRKKSSKKSRKPQKKVRFKQTCTMRRTLSRHDMTQKEIRRAWLSFEEYQRMQIRDEIIADRVEIGKCKPGTCIRGLESKIEETSMRKMNLRILGSEGILIEQERQWDEAGDSPHFFYDFTSFAYVYGPASEKALALAQEMARQDRLEAEKILASSSPFRPKGFRSRFTRRRSWA